MGQPKQGRNVPIFQTLDKGNPTILDTKGSLVQQNATDYCYITDLLRQIIDVATVRIT